MLNVLLMKGILRNISSLIFSQAHICVVNKICYQILTGKSCTWKVEYYLYQAVSW